MAAVRSLARWIAKAAEDPTLRRWVVRRLAGLEPPAAGATSGLPPYVEALPTGVADEPACAFGDFEAPAPATPIELQLAGKRLTALPDDPAAVFDQDHDDIEDLLALHRFAWVPLAGRAVDPAWVAMLWREWLRRYLVASEHWAWDPYTAAERAINILDFCRRFGLPGDRRETLTALAAHGPAIAQRLEYLGEGGTSNHLANDGRGLFFLGLILDQRAYADLGGKILIEEARRIFLPSGVLRENSSHYHLLLCRQYASAWSLARAFKRPEADALGIILRRAVGVLPQLRLSGGMPLIGDISPDCPPEFLSGLFPHEDSERGWIGLLGDSERRELRAFIDAAPPVDAKALAGDGWVRSDFGEWSALWHGAPGGWAYPSGHGHQDFGGFEIHYRGEPLLIDPGRGSYVESAEATLYKSGAVHNLLTVDGHDPFPVNKPYYRDSFRRAVSGPPPTLVAHQHGAMMVHHGFSRLSDVGALTRAWDFDASKLSISDRLDGSGIRRVRRRLITPLPVEMEGDAAILQGKGSRFRIEAEAAISPAPFTAWRAYGRARPATMLTIEVKASLPFEGRITIDAT